MLHARFADAGRVGRTDRRSRGAVPSLAPDPLERVSLDALLAAARAGLFPKAPPEVRDRPRRADPRQRPRRGRDGARAAAGDAARCASATSRSARTRSSRSSCGSSRCSSCTSRASSTSTRRAASATSSCGRSRPVSASSSTSCRSPTSTASRCPTPRCARRDLDDDVEPEPEDRSRTPGEPESGRGMNSGTAVDVEARAAIEAVMLAATEPVPPALLAQLVELPTTRVEELCDELAAEYERDGRGFQLARVAGGYRFQTHPDAYPYVERFVLEGQTARLSGPALETLAIIAYKQPIARAQISAIRGVNVDATLKTLVAARLRRGERARAHARQPGAVLHDERVPRAARCRLARRISRRSPTSFRSRASSRRSSGACAASTSRSTQPDDAARAVACPSAGDGPSEWRGRAAAEAARARRPRLAARVRGADRGGPGHGRRRRSRSSARGSTRRTRASRSTACRWSSTPPACTGCLNKPAGYVTTARDPQGRPTVVELVPAEPRAFPVGRLDRRHRGSARCSRTTASSPSCSRTRGTASRRTYLAEVEGVPAPAAMRRAARRGRARRRSGRGRCAPSRARSHGGGSALEIVINEGRKRIVRRMCAEIGHPGPPARAHAHRAAHRSEARPGRVPPAHTGRGAGALRRRARQGAQDRPD